MVKAIVTCVKLEIAALRPQTSDAQNGKTPQLAKFYKINEVTFFIPCKIFKWMDLRQGRRLIFGLLFDDRIFIWQEPFRKFILFTALGNTVQLNIEVRDIVQSSFQCDGERQRI